MPKWHREPDHFAHAGLFLVVIAEGLRSEIRQVAEGHDVTRHDIQALRVENEAAHREIISAIKFSYAELDQGALRILDWRLRGILDLEL